MNTLSIRGSAVALCAAICTLVIACSSSEPNETTARSNGPSLLVQQAWVRATPPGAKVSAGYLSLTNQSAKDVRLTGARFKAAGNTELHSMSMSDGMMQMRKLNGLDVAAGDSIALQQGGSHLMLMGLTKALSAGETLLGTLIFADGSELPVEFPVRDQPVQP